MPGASYISLSVCSATRWTHLLMPATAALLASPLNHLPSLPLSPVTPSFPPLPSCPSASLPFSPPPSVPLFRLPPLSPPPSLCPCFLPPPCLPLSFRCGAWAPRTPTSPWRVIRRASTASTTSLAETGPTSYPGRTTSWSRWENRKAGESLVREGCSRGKESRGRLRGSQL